MTLDATLTATVGTDVTFEYRVTAAEPVDLQFASGKVADVTVFESDEQVWQWGHNRMFTQALQTQTVTPDDPLRQTFTWSAPSAGSYEAVADLDAARTAEATTTFEVREQ